MLFNSFSFLLFLPLVFLLYWFVFKPLKWQNLLVVVASYVFYGWWDWRFLILIAFTSACSFISGIQIEKNAGNRNQADCTPETLCYGLLKNEKGDQCCCDNLKVAEERSVGGASVADAQHQEDGCCYVQNDHADYKGHIFFRQLFPSLMSEQRHEPDPDPGTQI